jgi:hypothetical protein
MALLLDQTAAALRDAGVVAVSGPDRLTYLHSLLSQDLQNAGAGSVADFLYLDAKGNALAEGRAVVTAATVLLVVPREVASSLTEALGRFTFLLEATTEDRSAGYAVASARGPGPVEHQGARSEPMTVAPAGPGYVIRDRSGGVDLIGPRQWVEQRVRDAGWPLASAQEWDAWRISAGLPAWGTEIAEGRRAQELGLLPTHVHLRKGCYPGQESIAKIFNLGQPRRALAVVELTGRVHPGDPVDVDGKTGEITSAAPAGDAWVALALVPVGRDGEVVGDGTVTVGSVTGRVRKRVGEDLPLVGA